MSKRLRRTIGLLFVILACPLLGGWTPPKTVLDQPITIPAEGGGGYDSGLSLGEFVDVCRKIFDGGKAEYTRTSRDSFSMRCTFKHPTTGQLFSNVADFAPTILGHHDALRLERFRGPDGTTFTPAQLKEHFDRLYAEKKPPEPSQSRPLDAEIHFEFKGDLRNTGLLVRRIAAGCADWQGGSVTYSDLVRGSLHGFILHCTLEPSKQLYLNQQSFLFVLSPASEFTVFLMGVNVKNTTSGASRPLSSAEIETILKSIRDRLLDEGRMESFDDGADPFSPNFRRCKNPDDDYCSRE